MRATLRDVRRELVRLFSLDELRVLASDVGVDWDELSGGNKASRAQGLVEACMRRSLWQGLIEQARLARPNGDWPAA